MKQIAVTLFMTLLLPGCKFSPEQRLLPDVSSREAGNEKDEEPRTRSASTASAISSAGRRSDATSAQRTSAGQASAAGNDAGDSTLSPDAGASAPSAMNAHAGMSGEATAPGSLQAGTGGGLSTDSGGMGGSGETPTEPKQAGAKDPTCDLSGVWITKQVAVSLALDAPQFVNTWGYYEVEQSGSRFVVKKHIDCGAEVLGSGTVTLSRATLEGNVQHNMQDGRVGSFERIDDKCAFDIARYWSVRGAEEARFIPNPTRDATVSMAELARTKPLPTPNAPEGAIDLEGDGELGAAGQIAGIISGTRNSCQRDWDRWFTAPGYEITPSMDFTDDLKVRMEYEAEESVMAPTTGLLTTPSESTSAWEHIMFLRFLGRSKQDPRAQPFLHEDAVETCYAIQDAMPSEELQR